MSVNFLFLNESKTEVMLFGPSESADLAKIELGTLSPYLKHQVKNLGITCDSALRFDKQINLAVKTSFFQLRLVAKIKPFVAQKDLEKMVHALIFSGLDYGNALYYGVQQKSLH